MKRILVLALGGGKTGFMVDGVSEVMRVPLDAIRPAPELSPEQINWNINTHNMTTTVVLVYASKYAEGEATETFTIVVDDEKPSLFGYQINSFDMIIK